MAWPRSVNRSPSMSSPMRTVTRLGVPHPSSSIGPMMKPPRLTGNIARSVLMICGALATGFSGKSTASRLPALKRLRQRRRAGRVLHANQTADAGQREAERQLDRGKLSEDQQQEREPGFRVRIEQADRLDVDRQHLQLEDPGVAVARRPRGSRRP